MHSDEERCRITFETSSNFRQKYERLKVGPRKVFMNRLLEAGFNFLEGNPSYWEAVGKVLEGHVEMRLKEEKKDEH